MTLVPFAKEWKESVLSRILKHNRILQHLLLFLTERETRALRETCRWVCDRLDALPEHFYQEYHRLAYVRVLFLGFGEGCRGCQSRDSARNEPQPSGSINWTRMSDYALVPTRYPARREQCPVCRNHQLAAHRKRLQRDKDAL